MREEIQPRLRLHGYRPAVQPRDGGRGRTQDEGDLLPPRRRLRGGRNEARPAGPGGREDDGRGRRAAGKGDREDGVEYPGDPRAPRPRDLRGDERGPPGPIAFGSRLRDSRWRGDVQPGPRGDPAAAAGVPHGGRARSRRRSAEEPGEVRHGGMRVALMKLLVVLLPLLLVPQCPPDEQGKRIQHLLAWFGDKDADVRQSARASLVAIGKAALPAIDKKLSERGALDLAALRRDIDRNLPAVADPYALPAEEAPADAKVERDLAEKYVRAKYGEALAFAKKENFQRGFDIAGSLHALEPRSAIAEKVNQLRRYCENKITQTTLIEAKILPEKPVLQIGEVVGVTLRLKDLFKTPVPFKYEGAEGKR